MNPSTIQIIFCQNNNNDDDFVLVGLETTPFLRIVPFQQCRVIHVKKVIKSLFFIAVPFFVADTFSRIGINKDL